MSSFVAWPAAAHTMLRQLELSPWRVLGKQAAENQFATPTLRLRLARGEARVDVVQSPP